MFEKTTLSTASALVSEVKPLNVAADTPLSVLTRPFVTGIEGIADDESVAMIDKLAKDVEETNHTTAMSEFAHVGAQAVRATLNLSRNVINPHLLKVIERYDSHMKDKAVEAVSPYKIVKACVPDIYQDPIVSDILGQYANIPALSMDTKGRMIGYYDREAIMRLLNVSDQRDINAKLREVLTSSPEKLSAFQRVLKGDLSMKSVSENYPELSLPLIIVLNAIEEPGEAVALTLTQWTEGKNQLINNAVSILKTYAGRQQAIREQNILYVMGAPRDGEEIHVNEVAYLHFLEKGLTANALIGNELLGRPYRASELLDNLPQLEEAYNREHLLLNEAFRNQLNITRMKAMVAAVRDDAKARIDAGEYVIEGDTAEQVNQRVRSILEGITRSPSKYGDQILNLTAAVLGVWYSHTDAIRYMSYRLEVERENPGLSAMEIATLATVRYVVAWTLSQTVVVE